MTPLRTLPLLLALLLAACAAPPLQEAVAEPKAGGDPGDACLRDDECVTPGEYLIQSNCPYESKCVKNTCAVVCPIMVHDQPAGGQQRCLTDADCGDCDSRAGDTADCRCVESACMAVMKP